LAEQAQSLAQAALAQSAGSRQSIDRLLTGGCRLVNTAVVVALLVVLAAAGWITRAVFDRIDVVAEAFGRLASGHLKTRLACSSRDEIGALSRRFNELASSLEGRGRQEPGAATPPAQPATASDPQPPAPCRVLVAEDGPENRRFISLVLKKTGAEVTLTENGSEAVEKALAGQRAGRPFDLILMDMQMPILDGYEATRRLRQQGYAGQISAVTAHAESFDRQKCLEAGCDSYLVKPLDRETLVSIVAGLQRSSASAR
jgi:CheY-like chemotaxis protein/HAMP domain-containing protein